MYQLDIYALLWIYRNEFSPNKAVTAFKEAATSEIKTLQVTIPYTCLT